MARVAPTAAPRRADLNCEYRTPVNNLESSKSSTISLRNSRSIVRTSVSMTLGFSGCGTRILMVSAPISPTTYSCRPDSISVNFATTNVVRPNVICSLAPPGTETRHQKPPNNLTCHRDSASDHFEDSKEDPKAIFRSSRPLCLGHPFNRLLEGSNFLRRLAEDVHGVNDLGGIAIERVSDAVQIDRVRTEYMISGGKSFRRRRQGSSEVVDIGSEASDHYFS